MIDNIDEHKCYCVCWCSADHCIATGFSSQEKRRELAKQYIKEGAITCSPLADSCGYSPLERFANRKATDTATEIKWRLSVAFVVAFEISGLLRGIAF